MKDMRLLASGRVRAVRTSGSKLVFVDLEEDGATVQVISNFGELEKQGITPEQFRAFKHIVRRGDWFSMLYTLLPVGCMLIYCPRSFFRQSSQVTSWRA